MILYHYTAREYLERIRREGLTTGEVPLSPSHILNGVWFTTDPDPGGHGLTGILNKRAVRITVKIRQSDSRLKKWSKWARSRVTARWYQLLNETGDGKADTWFIYFGTIPPEMFTAVDVFDNENSLIQIKF